MESMAVKVGHETTSRVCGTPRRYANAGNHHVEAHRRDPEHGWDLHFAVRAIYLTALGALAWAALILQSYLVITTVGPERGLGIWASVGWYFSFMTVLTNLWVAVFCTCVAMVPQTRMGRWMARYDVQAALLVYVLAVALVYHVLLTDAWDPQGWMKVVNVLMHVVIPVLYLVHWTMAAPKRTLRFGVLPLWLIYPVVYVVLAMCYGRATGRYPYPFLEVDIVGWASVVRTCAIILLGYALLAALIIVVNDRLAARERP